MKIKNLYLKFKHLVNLTAIAAVALFCFAWVGYDSVRPAVTNGHRQIINDEYSVITDTIGAGGIQQPITVPANTPFYGVRMDMHTYGQIVHGTIYVDLLDSDGNLIATASDDMTTLRNDIFSRFIFGGANFESSETKDYIISVRTEGVDGEDKVALWKSDVTVDGYGKLIENGKEAEGTLALQYIVKYITPAIWGYYIALCAVLFALLTGAYMLIFVKKAKITTVFVFVAALTGIVFSVYTPIRGAPDEYTHITSSYHNANRFFMEGESYKKGHLVMRNEDIDDFESPVNYNVFELHNMAEGLFKKADREGYSYVKSHIAKVFPPLYWAQTVGVAVALALDLSYPMLVICGRITNLVLYIALAWLAIRKMPVHKTTFALVALTPLPLQLAASFSYDTFVIGLCFLFIATVFDLAYKKESTGKKDVLMLVLLAALVAPAKAVYIGLVALCFIIPPAKFGGMKNAVISYALVFAVAVTMWFGYNSTLISDIIEAQNPEPDNRTEEQFWQDYYDSIEGIEDMPQVSIPVEGGMVDVHNDRGDINMSTAKPIEGTDILENGDSVNYFTLGYILNNIPSTLKLVINTVQDNADEYVRQIFGGHLGEVILSPVKVNWLYTFGIIITLFMSLLLTKDETLEYKGIRKYWAVLIAVGTIALLCAACVMWTPVNYSTVFGIQGRYFIPVLPLIIMFFGNDVVRLEKKIDGALAYTLCVLNTLVLLDGLTVMLGNTTVYY